MSPKAKYKVSAYAIKRAKRFNSAKLRYRGIPTGTAPKAVPLLPDKDNPVIIRVVTRSELAAIPRDRYKVKVIRVMVPLLETGEIGGEEKLVAAISISELLSKQLKDIRQTFRAGIRGRNGGGGGTPSGNPFREPIDQHKMADNIILVMDDFFHGEDKCTICDKDYNTMEFCVMMHIFFKKIHFLKKDTRLQFSKFAQNSVFAGKSGFVRSYNTYADKDIFKAFENQLDITQFNFKNHPVPLPPEKKPSDYRQRMMLDMNMAFQEIGWAFQKSPYFIKLKELKNTMNEFVLQ